MKFMKKHILLINNGEACHAYPRHFIKKYFPEITEKFKPVLPLMPRGLLGSLLSGFGTSEKRFPLGLGYLSAMLKQHGHSVCLLDRFADPGAWIKNIHAFDFIGVYTSTPCYEDALEILKRLETENYQGPVAFGGPHATVFPGTIPPRADYIVQGEAEYVINDLVSGAYPRGIILCTQRIKDLDALPRADYDLFMDKKRSYQFTTPFTDKKPIFNMNTSRSCPLACSFCTVRNIWGQLWKAQSAERIFDDILFLKRRYNIAGVYFREDFFPASKKRVARLCDLLLKNDVKIVWACETRVDAASDEELVRLMAQSGCRGFYIGAESGSQKMLDHYNKKIRVEQIYKTCFLAKKYGIAIAMSLIVAHPMETWKDRFGTWKLIRNTSPEILYMSAYRDEYARHGSVDFDTYTDRKIINVTFDNGTWAGQKQRLPAGCQEQEQTPTNLKEA